MRWRAISLVVLDGFFLVHILPFLWHDCEHKRLYQPPAASYREHWEWIAIGYEWLRLNITIMHKPNPITTTCKQGALTVYLMVKANEKKRSTRNWKIKTWGWIFIVFCHIKRHTYLYSSAILCVDFCVFFITGNVVSTFLSFVCYLFGFSLRIHWNFGTDQK